MRNAVLVQCAVLAVAILCGCMQEKQLLTVNKDGSGTLTVTHYYTKKASDGTTRDWNVTKDQIEGEAKEVAERLGPGVTVKSAELATDNPDMFGDKSVYAFDDVSKIAVHMFREFSAEDIHFKFTKSPNAKLTVQMQKIINFLEATKKGTAEDDANNKKLWGTAVFDFEIRVDGTITQTNAHCVNEKKDAAVLLREDIAGIIKDDVAFKKISHWTRPDREAAQDADLKKYVQIDSDETITIEFH